MPGTKEGCSGEQGIDHSSRGLPESSCGERQISRWFYYGLNVMIIEVITYPHLSGTVSIWMINYITLPIIGHRVSVQSEGAHGQDI